MPGVTVREGESIEEALRRFRHVCKSAKIQETYKRSLTYEKPSDRKRRKMKESEKRRARKSRNNY